MGTGVEPVPTSGKRRGVFRGDARPAQRARSLRTQGEGARNDEGAMTNDEPELQRRRETGTLSRRRGEGVVSMAKTDPFMVQRVTW